MKTYKSLTPFGIAVRKYRLEAGNKKLRDMAKATGFSIALHSAVEVGDKNPKDSLVEKSIKYFASLGIDANDLVELAKKSRKPTRTQWKDLTQEDLELITAFAKELPDLKQDEKDQIRKIISIAQGTLTGDFFDGV